MHDSKEGTAPSIGDGGTQAFQPGASAVAAGSEDYWFEDMPVGRVLRSARSIRMERDRMVAFAAEFDPQPAHLSEEEAAGSQFGVFCASGWHTGSASMRLVAETLRIANGGMGIGADQLRWPRPVLFGDELHVQIEVLAARPSRSQPGRGIVTMRITSLNQKNETVQELISIVLMPMRSPA